MLDKITFLIMLVATGLGILDLSTVPVKSNSYKVNPAIFQNASLKNSYLREKEEVGTHYISYSVSQRVAGRARNI